MKCQFKFPLNQLSRSHDISFIKCHSSPYDKQMKFIKMVLQLYRLLFFAQNRNLLVLYRTHLNSAVKFPFFISPSHKILRNYAVSTPQTDKPIEDKFRTNKVRRLKTLFRCTIEEANQAYETMPELNLYDIVSKVHRLKKEKISSNVILQNFEVLVEPIGMIRISICVLNIFLTEIIFRFSRKKIETIERESLEKNR